MHDGMQYDPIQGQGNELFKIGKGTIKLQLINFASCRVALRIV